PPLQEGDSRNAGDDRDGHATQSRAAGNARDNDQPIAIVRAPNRGVALNLTAAERRIVLLIGAVNFINVLDFMIVLPLGPDFARALAIPASDIGFIGGAYSAAACVAGLVVSFFLDRFDRRRALAACMAGLVVGTALGGVAFDLPSLLLARVVAGLFGGP